MSYGGFSGFGAGSASTDVGMTSHVGEGGMTSAVPEQGSGASPSSGWKDFAKQAGEELAKGGKGGGGTGGGGTGEGGSGSTLAAKRPIGEHPEAPKIKPSDTPARSGFARLAEVGPRQRKYGTP